MDTAPAIFLTLVQSAEERTQARLLIDSIRSFGGVLRHAPIWLFAADPQGVPCDSLAGQNIEIIPLSVPETAPRYYFANKVAACAWAEAAVPADVHTLIWIDPSCLIVQPPLLFNLGENADTAVRPVHIKNVGLLPTEPPDNFWQPIFNAVGVADITRTVETFVGGEQIRAYFNSHAFAINPARGVLRRWLALFTELVNDEAYQRLACPDPLHQIFLHQAIWSALLVTALPPERLRILPPDYNYPYNLHHAVPVARRAAALNDLVCLTYEDRTVAPDLVHDVAIHEPLWSWLSVRTRFDATANGQ